MMYSVEILKKIKSFGALQYPPVRIISILGDDAPSSLEYDLKDPESPAFIMYQEGFNAGRYRLDAEQFKLAEIETQKAKLQYTDEKEYIDLRKNLFGV